MNAEEIVAELREHLGQDLGVTDWIEMTQAKFDGFAEITGDRDWLHNDPERCTTESPFDGKSIAQGHLLLSHMSQFAESLVPRQEGVLYGLNYGYDRVRVIDAVTVGSRIRGRLTLKEIRPKGETQLVVKTDAAVEVEGKDGPALVAEWLFFVQLDPSTLS